MLKKEFPCLYATDKDRPAVYCTDTSQCQSCGWNPHNGVKERRIAAFAGNVRNSGRNQMSLSEYLEPERPLDEPEYDGPICDDCSAEIGSGEMHVLYENQRICRECLIERLKERISDDPFEIASMLDFGTPCVL